MGPELAPLLDLLRDRRIAVLTGAGISTDSGIPDYRGEGTRRRARSPIRFQEFIGDSAARNRYWARSAIGWSRIADARPNPAHQALADLESVGLVTGVITQNVDRLHHRAGSRTVVELHGALQRVRCLGCELVEDRDDLQARMLADNPAWGALRASFAPDGDADLAAELERMFSAPSCLRCNGALKPDVVFFGESVSRATLDQAWDVFHRSDVLLVVGTSLAVFSGYRFVRRASERSVPVAIVNLGECRGQELAAVKVEAPTGVILPALAVALQARAVHEEADDGEDQRHDEDDLCDTGSAGGETTETEDGSHQGNEE